MAKHHIKSWAHFYDAIAEGRKLHDLRKMDREYNVGDILVLQRYDNINGNYTGKELEVEVTYITSNKTPCAFSSSALDRDYAILSLKLLNPELAKGGPVVHNGKPYIYGEKPSEFPSFHFNVDRRPNLTIKTFIDGANKDRKTGW